LHDARIYSEGRSAGLGAQHVSIGDVQVVARDGDIEIVFKREGNGIVQRR